MALLPQPPIALPFSLLVAPAATWRQLAVRQHLWPLLLAEWLLIAAGWLIAGRAYTDLAAASGAAAADAPPPALLAVALGLLPLLVLINLGLGALVWAAFNLIGLRFSYKICLTWAAYGHLPVFVGRALSLVVFGISRPLADNPGQAAALQMSPAPLGLAPLFTPLSWPWTLAVFFDVFGVWAMVLLGLGAFHLLRLHPPRSAVALAALVLIWILVLTGVWQTIQAQAVRGF